MPISNSQALAIILVTAAATFFTRVFPFIIFPSNQKIPAPIIYLGAALPPTVIAVLLIYCIKDTDFTSFYSIAPQAIAIIGVVALHFWRKNNLLSIGGGTILYMLLVQLVFK